MFSWYRLSCSTCLNYLIPSFLFLESFLINYFFSFYIMVSPAHPVPYVGALGARASDLAWCPLYVGPPPPDGADGTRAWAPQWGGSSVRWTDGACWELAVTSALSLAASWACRCISLLGWGLCEDSRVRWHSSRDQPVLTEIFKCFLWKCPGFPVDFVKWRKMWSGFQERSCHS